MKISNKPKIILGVNGWMVAGHDASAALIMNGKMVAFAEEERFTRKRYSYDALPVNAIAFCLTSQKISVDDIDVVAFGVDLPKKYAIHKKDFNFTPKEIIELLFPRTLYAYSEYPEVRFIDHHQAHAFGGFFGSTYEDAAVLVLDGQGEDVSGTLGYISKNGFEVFNTVPVAYSLGYLMEAASSYLGFRTSDAGKLMGLAAHGTGEALKNFEMTPLGYKVHSFESKTMPLPEGLDDQAYVIGLWNQYFSDTFGKLYCREDEYLPLPANIVSKYSVGQQQKNFARSIQATLEKSILHLVCELASKTKCKNLVITGGVALNCSSNGKVLRSKLFENVFIPSTANDAGVSIGAAAKVYFDMYDESPNDLSEVYVGPEYGDKEIQKILDINKITYSFQENIAEKAARELARGKIIGWFQGRMEAGPRALGNRSILADPRKKAMHDTVNAIKMRENWRPLCPSVLHDFGAEYFEKYSFSPYMLQSYLVKPEMRQLVPAVVHVDGSARYQSVTSTTNPGFYKLLKEFYRLTQIPMIMNTSFNVAGEPVVCTPLHAIKTFYASGLDGLAIGNFWISK